MPYPARAEQRIQQPRSSKKETKGTSNNGTEETRVIYIGAIFFAMRSCEYLQITHKDDSRRTKILRLKNIYFKKDGKVLTHDSPDIALSNLVMIAFKFQKNNQRNKTVHMFKTNNSILCSVKVWAYTVQRVRIQRHRY